MTTAAADNMVLRTIYMPLDVDRRLREIAFSQNISKGELMRKLILDGIANIAGSNQETLAEKVERLAAAKAASEAKVAASIAAKAAAKPRAAGGAPAKTSGRTRTPAPKTARIATPARVLEPAE